VVIATLLVLLVVLIRKIITGRWHFRDTFLLLFFLTVLQYLVLSAGDMRYFYPYLPLGVILLGAGVVNWRSRIESSLDRRIIRRIVGSGPAWLLVVVSLLGSGYMIPRKIRTVPYEYKLLGEWMRGHLPGISDAVVLSRKLGVPFYTGSPHSLIYPGDYRELLEYADHSGAKYLVIDEWTIPRSRPELEFLLDEKPPPPELEKVYQVEYQGRKTVLYRFKKKLGERLKNPGAGSALN
jgi:hypothetical protein